MMLPVLSKAKEKARGISCLSNTRQLTQGWIMFATENKDKLMGPDWVDGDMSWANSSDNIDTAKMLSGTMGPYVKSAGVYRCPSDIYDSVNGPRVRSVSMNGALGGGSGPKVQGNYPDGKTYYGQSPGTGKAAERLSDLLHPGASQTYVILDEQADSINDGQFMHDPGYSPGNEHWRDLPASYHNRAGSFSFGDGHSEIHKWTERGALNPVTVYPVQRNNSAPWKAVAMRASADYEWVSEHMPYQ